MSAVISSYFDFCQLKKPQYCKLIFFTKFCSIVYIMCLYEYLKRKFINFSLPNSKIEKIIITKIIHFRSLNDKEYDYIFKFFNKYLIFHSKLSLRFLIFFIFFLNVGFYTQIQSLKAALLHA